MPLSNPLLNPLPSPVGCGRGELVDPHVEKVESLLKIPESPENCGKSRGSLEGIDVVEPGVEAFSLDKIRVR